MPRCPKCSYILVLLEERCRYKCAKCGRLFLQKQIEDKEFREWNIEQRKLGKIIRKKREKLSPLERKKRTNECEKRYYLKNRERILKHQNEKNRRLSKEQRKKANAERYAKSKEKIKAKARERYERNKTAILAKNKRWRDKNKEKIEANKRKYRSENKEKIRLKQRIIDWRQAQRGLLLMLLGEADGGILRDLR